MPDRDDLLVLERVTKRFDGIVALDNVSLRIPTHGIYGFVGPNGSGKTSLFDVITGFSPADSGTITFKGREISRLSAWRRGALQLGFMRTFQDPRGCRSLTVLENSLSGLILSRWHTRFSAWARRDGGERGEAWERAQEVLGALGLLDIAKKRADALSFGQRRRVELARALLSPAETFFLDEPFAGLDRQSVERVSAALTGLARRREAAVFLIDHREEVVERLCSEIYRMQAGRIC